MALLSTGDAKGGIANSLIIAQNSPARVVKLVDTTDLKGVVTPGESSVWWDCGEFRPRPPL